LGISDFFERKVLKECTYGKMTSKLRRAKKITSNKTDWELIMINPSERDMLIGLGLLPKEETPKRKRGRPKKNSI